MKQFEYSYKEVDGMKSAMDELNSWGRDGWELCHYEETYHTNSVGQTSLVKVQCLLKREIIQPELTKP
jgi:hypothetical protein